MRQGKILSLRKTRMLVSVEHGPYGVMATKWILAQFAPLGNGPLNDRSGFFADTDDLCRLYPWMCTKAFRYSGSVRSPSVTMMVRAAGVLVADFRDRLLLRRMVAISHRSQQ